MAFASALASRPAGAGAGVGIVAARARNGFVGEPVAAVFATDSYVAEDADIDRIVAEPRLTTGASGS